MKFLFTILLFFVSVTFVFSQSLKVNIIGIRNNTGNIRLAFYNNSKAFDEERALFIKTISKKNTKNKHIQITLSNLKPGIYGIAILDDENENEKMDYGWVLPEEGFGFSDYYHEGMKRPKFDAFKFELKENEKIVEIKLRYM
jgi:uncharacterized protein (DUF2141 family)